MIAPFALQPEALRSESADPGSLLAHHEDLIQCWSQHGVLVEPSGEARGKLAGVVTELAQPLKLRWQRAMLHNLRAPGPRSWAGFSEGIRESLQKLDGHVDLVCLAREVAAEVGLQPDSYGWTPPGCGIEVSRIGVVHHSASFTHARRLGELGEIRQGIPIADLWRTYFAPLAQFERSVTLIDRFAVDGVLGRGEASGLAVLLRKLNIPSSAGCRLTIFSQPGPDGPRAAGEAVASAVAGLPAGGLTEVELCQVTDWRRCQQEYRRVLRFRDSSSQPVKRSGRPNIHDRCLRFGRHVCWIGVGIEVLEGDVTCFTSFGHALLSDGLRAWETAMRSTSDKRTCRPSVTHDVARSA